MQFINLFELESQSYPIRGSYIQIPPRMLIVKSSIPCTFPHSMAGWWRIPDVMHCHDGKADCDICQELLWGNSQDIHDFLLNNPWHRCRLLRYSLHFLCEDLYFSCNSLFSEGWNLKFVAPEREPKKISHTKYIYILTSNWNALTQF